MYAECHGDLVGVFARLDERVLRLHPSGATEPPPWMRWSLREALPCLS